MIDRINRLRAEHIITIEDPDEFLHRDKKGYVNQREVEVDTPFIRGGPARQFGQDPEVILGRRNCATWKPLARRSTRLKTATWSSPLAHPGCGGKH